MSIKPDPAGIHDAGKIHNGEIAAGRFVRQFEKGVHSIDLWISS